MRPLSNEGDAARHGRHADGVLTVSRGCSSNGLRWPGSRWNSTEGRGGHPPTRTKRTARCGCRSLANRYPTPNDIPVEKRPRFVGLERTSGRCTSGPRLAGSAGSASEDRYRQAIMKQSRHNREGEQMSTSTSSSWRQSPQCPWALPILPAQGMRRRSDRLDGGINSKATPMGHRSQADPLGLATYQCNSQADTRPVRVGPVYHQYVCTATQGRALMPRPCPTGSMFDSPGKLEPDAYKPEACEKVDDDNQCIEAMHR